MKRRRSGPKWCWMTRSRHRPKLRRHVFREVDWENGRCLRHPLEDGRVKGVGTGQPDEKSKRGSQSIRTLGGLDVRWMEFPFLTEPFQQVPFQRQILMSHRNRNPMTILPGSRRPTVK